MRRRFRIIATPDPQSLPRIIGVFAQRSLIPAILSARRQGDVLHIAADFDDLDPTMASIIAGKLCETVLVAEVSCDPVDDPASAGALRTVRLAS